MGNYCDRQFCDVNSTEQNKEEYQSLQKMVERQKKIELEDSFFQDPDSMKYDIQEIQQKA